MKLLTWETIDLRNYWHYILYCIVCLFVNGWYHYGNFPWCATDPPTKGSKLQTSSFCNTFKTNFANMSLPKCWEINLISPPRFIRQNHRSRWNRTLCFWRSKVEAFHEICQELAGARPSCAQAERIFQIEKGFLLTASVFHDYERHYFKIIIITG